MQSLKSKNITNTAEPGSRLSRTSTFVDIDVVQGDYSNSFLELYLHLNAKKGEELTARR